MDFITKKHNLVIKDLAVSVKETPVLRGVNLEIHPGETHVIMGPNGSGKSTLLLTLAGHPNYQVTGGSAQFDDEDLITTKPTDRARSGLFLAFQYPQEIGGVTLGNFSRLAKNAIEKSRDENSKSIGPAEFAQKVKTALTSTGLDEKFLGRGVNEGFSGGEKKRAEITQMILLEQTIALLDEIDSGLDVDALRQIAEVLTATQRTTNCALVLVTHNARMTEYLKPTHVHVMIDGRIVESGGSELIQKIEQNGYEGYTV